MEPIEDMYKQTRRTPLDICLLFKKTSISDISNIDNNVFASLQSGHKVWWISIKWVNYVSGFLYFYSICGQGYVQSLTLS